ncbi:MAG: transglutaminase-like domain-containing protein [Myxococcota bacterium]
MADLPADLPLPVPETADLGRYLEDTITIDWQTPSVSDCARRLLEGLGEAGADARIERLFTFVRDEIAHSFDLESASAVGAVPAAAAGLPAAFFARGIACRASEVLALGHGLCFAKSHLLVALLRFAGHPAGFCYARLVDDERPGRFVLHGFVACLEPTRGAWVLLDPRGNRGGAGAIASECRFDPPYSLAYAPDPERGETLLPFVYKRPAKRIVDFLERVPDRAALRRSLPDSIG